MEYQNDKNDSRRTRMSWLDNLKELKKNANAKACAIAAGTGLPERTVVRIFNGETDNPSISTLIPIVNFLGGSLDELFADTKAVVGNKNLAVLQERLDIVTAERDLIIAENAMLTEKITAQTAEIELLKLKLMHKEELIAVHNYYTKISKV
jgi:transcriptional regulator with XRE-family HTH domain